MATRRNARPAPVDTNNPAYQAKMQALYETLVPAGFQKLDVTFPPYWKAGPATGFRAIFLRKELPAFEFDGNGEISQRKGPGQFARYIWKNTGPAIDCRRGKVADGEIETVETGRIFSTGVFGGLAIDRYRGQEMAVICKDMTTLPGNAESDFADREMWVFDTWATPEAIALIESEKSEDIERLQKAQREADMLAKEEMLKLNAMRQLKVLGYGSANI